MIDIVEVLVRIIAKIGSLVDVLDLLPFGDRKRRKARKKGA